MEQIERESRDIEEVRHVPGSVITVPSTREQTNQVGARFIDRAKLTPLMLRSDYLETR